MSFNLRGFFNRVGFNRFFPPEERTLPDTISIRTEKRLVDLSVRRCGRL